MRYIQCQRERGPLIWWKYRRSGFEVSRWNYPIHVEQMAIAASDNVLLQLRHRCGRQNVPAEPLITTLSRLCLVVRKNRLMAMTAKALLDSE
jgi:hypothetical protein